MAKTMVMYYSKYGSTKKYAEWIASALDGDIYDIKNVKEGIWGNYNTIILGSGLYAGKIEGINLIKNNYETLKNKKLVLFTCGLADYSKAENVNTINKRLEKELPVNIRDNLKIYYLRGDINYKELTLKHKAMMWMLMKMIKNKGTNDLNEENKEFLETYGQKVDFMDKDSIKELVNHCKQTNSLRLSKKHILHITQ
jgi:menaquinone-dependent protoporphyrinogen IX oxidase